MCLAPYTMYIGPKGEQRSQKVACRECWQCRERAVADWQGRNIAESLTSVASHAVTLSRKEWDVLGHIGEEVAAQRGLKLEWGGRWKFYDPAHWQVADFQHVADRGYPFATEPDMPTVQLERVLRALRDGEA